MKCKNCNGCLKVIRIDKEINSFIYWYCTLCKKVYEFSSRKEILDKNIIDEVGEFYKNKHGTML